MLAPETHLLFLGARTRLLAYDPENQCRLWKDVGEFGFGSWDRYVDVILMSAELEMAAWDTRGKKLWSTFVEPPWSYSVHAGAVKLEIMGTISVFPMSTGRPCDRHRYEGARAGRNSFCLDYMSATVTHLHPLATVSCLSTYKGARGKHGCPICHVHMVEGDVVCTRPTHLR
jgi:hypothetical protein